jgi:hypothetical protein
MKLYQSVTAVCLVLVTGTAACECFAQSATNQKNVVAEGTAPQDSTLAAPTVTPDPAVSAGKTREQVMRELEDFQNSAQAAKLRDLYQGGS